MRIDCLLIRWWNDSPSSFYKSIPDSVGAFGRKDNGSREIASLLKVHEYSYYFITKIRTFTRERKPRRHHGWAWSKTKSRPRVHLGRGGTMYYLPTNGFSAYNSGSVAPSPMILKPTGSRTVVGSRSSQITNKIALTLSGRKERHTSHQKLKDCGRRDNATKQQRRLGMILLTKREPFASRQGFTCHEPFRCYAGPQGHSNCA